MNVSELFVTLGFRVSEGSLNGVNDAIAGLRRRLGLLAVYSAGKQIFGFVEHATEAASHLLSLSKAVGMTVQQFQEWEYVAKQSGSNGRELVVGISMLERNLAKLANGTASKQVKALFKQVGVDQKQAAAMMASPDGLNAGLLTLADTFKKAGNTPTMGMVMQRLSGAKAGKALVADFARGSEGIKELMNRRKAMGEVNEKETTQLRELGNHMKDVKTSLEAMATVALAKLAPALEKIADKALAWVVANKKLLIGAFRVAIDLVADAFKLMGFAIDGAVKAFHFISDNKKGFIAILAGITAMILYSTIPALVKMALSLWASITPASILAGIFTAMNALPIIAIGVAVAALVYLIMKYWDDISGFFEGVWNYMSGLMDSLSKGWDEFWDDVKTGAKDAFDYVVSLDWLDAIPGVKTLKGIGHDIGNSGVAKFLTGTQGLDKIVTANDRAPKHTVVQHNTFKGSKIDIHTTDAKGVKETITKDYNDRANRHAAASLGGNIK